MSYGETQKKEIETIKERTFNVKLSDADYQKVTYWCGMHSITVSELLANFIGDLVGGTYSNGSDEEMYVNEWFNRCWFGISPESSLLSHLLSYSYDPQEYLNILDEIQKANASKRHPEDFDEEEVALIDVDIEEWEEKLENMRYDWTPNGEPDMNAEIEFIKKWLNECKEGLYAGSK